MIISSYRPTQTTLFWESDHPIVLSISQNKIVLPSYRPIEKIVLSVQTTFSPKWSYRPTVLSSYPNNLFPKMSISSLGDTFCDTFLSACWSSPKTFCTKKHNIFCKLFTFVLFFVTFLVRVKLSQSVLYQKIYYFLYFFITIYGLGLTVIGDRPTLPTTEARAGGCGGAGPGAPYRFAPRPRPTQTSFYSASSYPDIVLPDIALSSYPRHRPIVLSQTSSYRPFCKTVIVLPWCGIVLSSYPRQPFL